MKKLLQYLPEVLHNHDLKDYFCPNLILRQSNWIEMLHNANGRRKTELRSSNDKFPELRRLARVLFDESTSLRSFGLFGKNMHFLSIYLPMMTSFFLPNSYFGVNLICFYFLLRNLILSSASVL